MWVVCIGWIAVWIPAMTGNHHRVAAKVVSKIERGRPATSVHGFVLAVFRARARARARARSIDRSSMRLYQSILVNTLLGPEFGNGLDNGDKEHDPRVGERRFGGSNESRIDAMHAKRSITSTSTSTSTRGSCGRVGQRACQTANGLPNQSLSILVQLAGRSPDISAMGGDIPDDRRVGA